jgi:cytochrome P450
MAHYSQILWAFVANANLLVYWQILFILFITGLGDRIREEVAPFATVTKPLSIGSISEAPELKIAQESLLKKFPLLKSTFLESLRMSDQAWPVRKVAEDVVIQGDKKDPNLPSFSAQKGESITIPHDLHMRGPQYFKDPGRFDLERFLVRNRDSTLSTSSKTMKPFGGGASMYQG